MNQQAFIQRYSSDPRHVYMMNPKFFQRDEDEIIYYLEQLYLSIQKTMGVNAYFGIKIERFDVIDDYETVKKTLEGHQENAIKKSVKLRGIAENRYSFIDLKESDIKLLVVQMRIDAYDGYENVETVLAVPRVIDGQYLILNGTVRVMMMQLVDASTYNNQTSNTKNPMVVFKTNFQPIKVYRNTYKLHTITNEDVECMSFDCDVFSKSLPACEYIFARMGLLRGLQFFGVDGFVYITSEAPKDNQERYYIFQPKKGTSSLYIWVPRMLFDSNPVLQHIIYTITMGCTHKFMTLSNIGSNNTWLESLGRHFTLTDPRKKAISVLSSFEMIYDLMTKEITRLDECDMKDTYTILRWILYEYNALIIKSNLDVYSKRVRTSEYIAYLIAPKLSKAIYALSDMGERVNLASIKKRILLSYDFLLSELGKQTSIIEFCDIITDCDSFGALQYSRNGPSAISEGNSNASMPIVYRYLHPSSLGVLDDCASGNSAPGIAGVVCPLSQVYPGGYFNPDYKEPSEWRNILKQQINQYQETFALKEIVDFKNRILEDSYVKEMQIKDFYLTEEDKQRLLATANR